MAPRCYEGLSKSRAQGVLPAFGFAAARRPLNDHAFYMTTDSEDSASVGVV